MSKLRMERRKKVTTFIPVYNSRTNALLGYLGDLTLKGALLVSEKPIKPDRAMTLAIEFRKVSEKPIKKRINISSRVAWCKLEDHRTYYNTGLEFQEMTPQNQKQIKAILEKCQYSRNRPSHIETT